MPCRRGWRRLAGSWKPSDHKPVKPTYTRRARRRMAFRVVAEEQVEEVILSYDTRYIDKGGNPSYIGSSRGRCTRVVVENESKPPHGITVIIAG